MVALKFQHAVFVLKFLLNQCIQEISTWCIHFELHTLYVVSLEPGSPPVRKFQFALAWFEANTWWH